MLATVQDNEIREDEIACLAIVGVVDIQISKSYEKAIGDIYYQTK